MSPGSGLPEPSNAARALLRAFREHESPSPDQRAQGLRAVRSRLRRAEPAPAANDRAYGVGRTVLAAVGLAAAVLLGIKAVSVGVTALASQARQPAVEAPYQGRAASEGGQAVSREREPSPRSAAGSDGALEVAEPSLAAPSLPAPAVASRPDASSSARPSRTRSAAEASPSDLEAELSLIKRATKAKGEGRHADGLAALREHAQRFPQGMLADERVVLEAELRCASGRVHEARALVDAFLRRSAGSALAGRMRNVCRD